MEAQKLRNKKEEELHKLLSDRKEELRELNFSKGIGEVQNPNRIKEVKKDIARIKTILNN